MDFYIKQNSELPILEIRPIKNKFFDDLSTAIKTASATFSMYDENNCFKILNKEAIIEFKTIDNQYHNIEDTKQIDHDFRIQYKFTSKDTNKSGKFKGIFKINFDDKIYPIPLMIYILTSNIK
jgi:hypothetical protein